MDDLSHDEKKSIIKAIYDDRLDLASVLEKYRGLRKKFEDPHSDLAHFIFELLQNAEDQGASAVAFSLQENSLVFEHNGQTFTESDIKNITDFGENEDSKIDDQNKIGRFGVGFKSVFQYTATPKIWSPTFSFQIERLVLPVIIDDVNGLDGKTRFEFPFNNPEKPKGDAFSEIQKGLSDLSPITLLFLNNVKEVCWEINGDNAGKIFCIHHSDNHIEITKNLNDSGVSSSHYLRFAESVPDLPEISHNTIAVAFDLQLLPGVGDFDANLPISNQFKIVPATLGCVCISFPAENEKTGLRFILHAPFIPTLDRSSIKKTPPAEETNEPLYNQLAAFCGKIMHDIKSLGLLNRDFLNVLPNPRDDIPSDWCKKIRETITLSFKEEALTPTNAGDHSPANELFQSRASLKSLVSDEDLKFLIDWEDKPPLWAVTTEKQGTDVEQFLSGLEMQTWEIDAFIDAINSKSGNQSTKPDEGFIGWLSGKEMGWLQQFYAVLADPEAKKMHYKLSFAHIVRTSDGEFKMARDCYFKDSDKKEVSIVSYLDQAILEIGSNARRKDAARDFLASIGVKEVGDDERIREILVSGYSSKDSDFDLSKYSSDLDQFIFFHLNNPRGKSFFKDYNIFLGVDGRWHTAQEIFLDKPLVDTGLSEYFELTGESGKKIAPADIYVGLCQKKPELIQFMIDLGAQRYIEISETTCENNPQWEYLRQAPGGFSYNAIDSDYVINGFENLKGAMSEKLSRLIWSTMCKESAHDEHDENRVLTATYQKNRSGGFLQDDSQLVHQLRKVNWVAQTGGNFVIPADAQDDALPAKFPFDQGWAWVEKIKFGKNKGATIVESAERTQSALHLGFEADELDLIEFFISLPKQERRKMIMGLRKGQQRQSIPLPNPSPPNPDRRAEKTREVAASAPGRESEKRRREVSVYRDQVKAEAGPYLESQYLTDDGWVICQICQKPMPFKLDDGTHYYEKVEFLNELRKRYYHNYLALCPNHAAMFMHANSTTKNALSAFLQLGNGKQRLGVILAGKERSIYFTATHIADLKVIIEADKKFE